ncbi:MAG: hypothetical protein ACLQSR_03005 [Limisphaerales bacterium]
MRDCLIRSVCRHVLPMVCLAGFSARAQEALIDAMANDEIAQTRAKQAQISDYTFKSGDFRMLVTPSLSLQWNDNINCTQTNLESDLIVLPTVGVIMSYPLTEQNLLQLNLTMGYSDYVFHPDLSSYYLESGSGLSFNMYIKKILINLHDQFSYTENASQNAQVAGTGLYGAFVNSIGLSANWNLEKIVFTLGYDHQNNLSTSSQFNDTDSSVESGYVQTGYQWNSRLTTGVEVTAAYTSYAQEILNDNTVYSAGVYGDWHPDAFIHVQPRIGYTIDEFQQTSQDIQNSAIKSWYADLNIGHQISQSVSYTLDVGHQVSPGVQSSATEDWYVNSGVTWKAFEGLTLSPSFSYQHGDQGAGAAPIGMQNNNLVFSEIYDWYSASLGLSHRITRRLDMSVSYQITDRSSSISNRGYLQNVVGLVLTYHPL